MASSSTPPPDTSYTISVKAMATHYELKPPSATSKKKNAAPSYVKRDKTKELTFEFKSDDSTNYLHFLLTIAKTHGVAKAEETDLDKQPEVAQQLLNSDPSVTPCRITRSRQRGAIESLREFPEQEEMESEAKSFETDPFDEYQTLYYTPTPEMTTPSASTVPEELAARTISMAMIETINDKKDESSKGPVPDPYEGEHSDTRRFLLNLELYFRMNPLRADTDEKKKMVLLSC
uniref:Uncharacterized protein n=1 Tax=Moniliophthora roreri TaxID=221103 RepID=A0A0W0EVR8_MONRR